MIAYNLLHRALVAQGIERLPPEQKAAGSNPVKGTIFYFVIPFRRIPYVLLHAVDVLRFFQSCGLDLLNFILVCDIFASFLVGAR